MKDEEERKERSLLNTFPFRRYFEKKIKQQNVP